VLVVGIHEMRPAFVVAFFCNTHVIELRILLQEVSLRIEQEIKNGVDSPTDIFGLSLQQQLVNPLLERDDRFLLDYQHQHLEMVNQDTTPDLQREQVP
jgi:hypothetical protein